MIDTDKIFTEDDLAEVLTQCGYASEPASLSKHWNDVKLLHPGLFLARHLTEEKYQNLYIVVQNGVLQIYSWIMLVCKMQGELTPEAIVEKIDLIAIPERSAVDLSRCICLDMPLPFFHYEALRNVGVDKTNGRFGEVTLKRCLHCDRLWLHYFVEYEAYRKSGRYYMGAITPEAAEEITPETSVTYLESLNWYLYGGSFFDGAGKSTDKSVYVDC